MGGLLALAVTNLLETAGRSVDQVALFDVYLPERDTGAGLISFKEFLSHFLNSPISNLGLPPAHEQALGEFRDIIGEKGIDPATVPAEELSLLLPAGSSVVHLLGFLRQQYSIQSAHWKVMRQFVATQVRAPLHVFWAEESQDGSARLIDWRSLTKNHEASTESVLSGTHETVMLSDDNTARIVETLLRKDREPGRMSNDH